MRTLLIITISLLVLCSCAVGPDYKRPAVDAPGEWRDGAVADNEYANKAWWGQFQDPALDSLIGIALRESKDLGIATARVQEYMGRYRITAAGRFPQINAGGSALRKNYSDYGSPPASSQNENPVTDFQAGLNGSWELDLWGRVRRSTEAARAEFLATEEARRAVIMSLVCSVATAYTDLRDLDKQLEIAQRTAKTREEAFGLFKLRFDRGLISELELRQVESEYRSALAKIPFLQKQITQQENGLSVLIGRNPGAIPRGKALDDLLLPAVPAGLPSGLLERRPDILQAEKSLIAANARIGAAKALYFPTISLTGLYGVESTDLSLLFTGPAKTWNYAASITMPIFNAGKTAGQVKAAEAVQVQALLTYQQVIQRAFREVDDGLVDQKKTREQLAEQKRQVEALRSYEKLARIRYENGYTSYLEVLDAQRSLFNAELDYTQTHGNLFRALVNLYKAMGGGWVTEAEKLAKEK